MDQGACSQHFIFFVTQELAQQFKVFVNGNPFQLSVMEKSSFWGRFVSYE